VTTENTLVETNSAELAARLIDEPYRPDLERSFWEQYRPRIIEFLNDLQVREDWTQADLSGKPEEALVRLMDSLVRAEGIAPQGMPTLVRILAALPFRQCVFTLFWLEARRAQSVREVLTWALEQRQAKADASPAANILWQRIERVTRFHVLEDLRAQLVAGISQGRA
jgi:hypothetical protein